MSQRLNITIPNPLHKRLSKFKDKFNISKICQEAINHAVRIEEMKAEAPSIDSLAERLKAEELKHGKKYIEEGFEYGIKDAFSYLNLDAFLYIEMSREDGGCYKWHEDGAPFFPSEKTIKGFKDFDERTNHLSEEGGIIIDQVSGIGWMLEPKHYFFRGWLDGVYHIWDQVKEKLIALDGKPEQLSVHQHFLGLQEEGMQDCVASEDDEN